MIPSVAIPNYYKAPLIDGKYGWYNSGNYLYKSSDFGSNWTQFTGVTVSWKSLAVSCDGKYVVATSTTGIYYSSDYGTSFTLSTSTSGVSYSGIVMSESGQYLGVINDSTQYVYVSSDYGATWTLASSVATTYLAISGNGQYFLAIAQASGYLRKSSNYGVSYTNETGRGSHSWMYAEISYSGQYQYATWTTGSTGSYLCNSTDYGSTWANLYTTLNAPQFIRASRDGQYLVVTTSSTTRRWYNYGGTTTSISSADGYTLTGMSGTGLIVILSYNASNIIKYSINAGSTMNTSGNALALYTRGAINHAGDVILSYVYYGNLYKSTDKGATWTQVASSALRTFIVLNKYAG